MKNSIDKVIEKAPSFKDIEIKSNLEKFRLFNRNLSGRKDDSGDDNDDDDNDDGNDNNNSRVSKAPVNLLELPDIPKQDLTGMAKNIEPETEKQPEKYGKNFGRFNYEIKKIELNSDVNEISPKAPEILSGVKFEARNELTLTSDLFQDLQESIKCLKSFGFCSDVKIQILRKESEKLAELVLSNEYALLMRRSKISINFATGNIFFEYHKKNTTKTSENKSNICCRLCLLHFRIFNVDKSLG